MEPPIAVRPRCSNSDVPARIRTVPIGHTEKRGVRTMTFLLIAVVVALVLAVLVAREVRHDHPRTAPASFHSDTGAPEEQLEHV